jgi:MFS family permease
MESKEDKIKRSLKYSIIDGAFYSAMVGFGESFLNAFAVFLQATTTQLSILGSLPITLGSLSQLVSNKLLKVFKKRKKLVCTFALMQGLMYIPFALVYFFGTLRVYHLIIFACLYWIFGMMVGPAWSSWMGDLVNEKDRGSYFGRRSRISGFVTFITFMAAGYLLQMFTDGDMSKYIGFAILFCTAVICRMLSLTFLSMKYEPDFELDEKVQFSLPDFLKQSMDTNFGRFVLFMCLMNFGIYIAAPFFTVYMLNDLKFSYATFTIVTAASMIVKFFTYPFWGKVSDKYGTRKIMTFTGILVTIVPLLWVFSTNVTYLIIAQAFIGFFWAGFEIATFNYIFDATSQKKRTTCIAYYNVLNGLSLLAGALIGGLIVKYNHLFWSQYILVFIISFAIRGLATAIFVPKLKEMRTVQIISYPELLKEVSLMPTQELVDGMTTVTATISTFKKRMEENKKDKKEE